MWGWVEVDWKALVGGFLGEEKGVEGVRREMVGGGEASRGLCEMGGKLVERGGVDVGRGRSEMVVSPLCLVIMEVEDKADGVVVYVGQAWIGGA